jgi:hypothetical protein
LRGRDPKKILVGVAEAVDLARRLRGHGIEASGRPRQRPCSTRGPRRKSVVSPGTGGRRKSEPVVGDTRIAEFRCTPLDDP